MLPASSRAANSRLSRGFQRLFALPICALALILAAGLASAQTLAGSPFGAPLFGNRVGARGGRPRIITFPEGLYAWGDNSQNELTLTSNPVTTATQEKYFVDLPAEFGAGNGTSTYIMSDGSVWTGGSDSNGQFGNGTTGGTGYEQADGISNAVAIAQNPGSNHIFVLLADGTAMTWGSNSNGQLGNNTTADSNVPVQVLDSTGAGPLQHLVAIAAGTSHSLALKRDGTVWAWGWDQDGQVGVPGALSSVPLPDNVPGLPKIVAISGGDSHSMALDASGNVWAWGNNYEGELGNGTFAAVPNTPSPTPSEVMGLSGVTAISSGGHHCMALKSNGTVWTWGSDQYGQLGDGGSTNQALPIQVPGLSGIVQISAGFRFNIAVDSSYDVWAWGDNSSGQLGRGSSGGQSAVPAKVTFPSGVSITTACAGYDHVQAEYPYDFPSHGHITFDALDSSAALQLVVFQISLPQNTSLLTAATVSPATGSFTLQNVPSVTTTVDVSSEMYLKNDLSTSATSIDASLIPGDLNADNQINLDDFNLFVQAFGASIGDSNWNPDADLNGDGQVNLDDYNIFVQYFGLTGDP